MLEKMESCHTLRLARGASHILRCHSAEYVQPFGQPLLTKVPGYAPAHTVLVVVVSLVVLRKKTYKATDII